MPAPAPTGPDQTRALPMLRFSSTFSFDLGLQLKPAAPAQIVRCRCGHWSIAKAHKRREAVCSEWIEQKQKIISEAPNFVEILDGTYRLSPSVFLFLAPPPFCGYHFTLRHPAYMRPAVFTAAFPSNLFRNPYSVKHFNLFIITSALQEQTEWRHTPLYPAIKPFF